jgi:glycosyltransferase involved in cell wall biosynthesis
VIFVNQSLGYLSTDTIRHFLDNNEDVLVIAGSDLDLDLDSKKLRIIKCCKYNRKNTFSRLFSWITFSFQTIYYINKFSKYHKEVFLVSNPPLLFFIPLLFKRQSYYLLIYDLYPDIFKINLNSRAYKLFSFWERLNKKVFAQAKLVFTIGQNMKTAVSTYVSEDKISVVYNWANQQTVSVVEKDDEVIFSELKNKFIITYSGNMGATHNFYIICEFIELFQKFDSNVCFVFAGSGEKLKVIQNFVEDKKLSNVYFYSKLPFATFTSLLRLSNMGVVTLDEAIEYYSVPSKTATYLNEGLPILNFSSKNSEVHAIVENYKIGVNVIPNDLDSTCKEITKLIANVKLYTNFRENAFLFSKNMFSSFNSKKYYELIVASRQI